VAVAFFQCWRAVAWKTSCIDVKVIVVGLEFGDLQKKAFLLLVGGIGKKGSSK
jgi:hypothetical protein